MATSSCRNSNKSSPSKDNCDPLINFAPAKAKTKATRSLRSNKEIRNLTSKDDNEEIGNKNDNNDDNVAIPTDSELQLESVNIPPVEKSLLDKTKRNNKKKNPNVVIESQVQKKQKNKSGDVVTIEDHQIDTMQSKRKHDNSGNSGYDDSTTKIIRLDEKDATLLKKAILYSQSAYDEALEAKEAAIESKKAALEAKEVALRTESVITEYLKEQALQEKESEDSIKFTFNKKNKRKSKVFWYTDTMMKACVKLFQLNKFPDDKEMSEYIHSALSDAHPDEIEKIDNSKGGWANYWMTILQPSVRDEFRVKRAGYVRNIKNAIINVFGKAYIGNYPGHKATAEEVFEWKTSPSVKRAKENLWNKVENGRDDSDTYINRITNEVLRDEVRTEESCAFIVTVVNLMLDSNVQTTTFSSELIRRRLKEISTDDNDAEIDEPQSDDASNTASDDNEQ